MTTKTLRFIAPHRDPWRTLGGDDGPPISINPAPHLLLDLAQWHAARAHWPAGIAVGLALANDQDIEDVAGDLPRLALVALHFPKFADGRAYSQARLLRGRYRFAGEIRATGDVIADMAPLLLRSGFDSAQLRHDQSADTAERALAFFRAHYQGDVRGGRPIFALGADERAALTRTPAEDFVQYGASI
jgi:uncharacterized protein (DUF934 family)